MGHNHKNFSRRNFLNLLGSTTALPLMQSPVQMLIESIVMGSANSAAAAELGIAPRTYLNIVQEGAPARWTFDQFLTPYDPSYVAHPYIGTIYTPGGANATSISYQTIQRKGLNVPYMWQFAVPKAGGGTRPMDQLLDNMIQIRGIAVGNPDHGAAQALMFEPLGAAQSMPALSADASNSPIASVNASVAQFKFKSNKAKSAITVSSSGNMLSSLLEPFTRKDPNGFTLKRTELESALNASLTALNASAEALHPGAQTLSNSTQAAKDLLSQGFGNLTQTWSDLLNKYQGLITRAFDPTVVYPGINDRPIPTDGTTKFQIGTRVVTASDMRKILTAKSSVGRMASHFAMAEYILMNNLSSSISISLSDVNNVALDGVTPTVSVGYDEHDTSGMVSLYSNTYLNLAYSACLLELIDRLKAKNLFNDTVIITGGEFSRNMKNDGTGSDHGYMGGCSTMYSGAIAGPVVVGNILKNKTSSTEYRGTWGEAAPIDELGKPLDLSHWASTVAFLLRVPSPVSAGNSLFVTQNGVIIPVIGKAKQV